MSFAFNARSIARNIYMALLLQMGLVMVLYTLCRLGFYLHNIEYFKGLDTKPLLYILWGGLRFDLSAILYLNSLFILLVILPWKIRFKPTYQTILKYIFLTTNSIGIAANIMDFAYYRFTLRRTTLSVFHEFKNEENLGALSIQFLFDYWYLLLIWIGLVAILWYGYKLIKVEGPHISRTWAYYVSGFCAMLGIIYLVVGGMRGGFRHSTRPITLSNAARYVENPRDIPLVLNTPFAFMRTAGTTVIEKAKYFDNENELANIFTPVHFPPDSASFRPENVMIIILESFSKEFIGAYNQELEDGTYKGYAPFMDSLISVSRAWQYSMANGRKSIDAMPSIICSIPSIEVPYVLSHYSNNRVNCLAGLLKEKGYYTAFFHGAPNGSMGFEAFANMCGFDDYFGMTEYDNDEDFDDMWGIWDHTFMPWMLTKLNELDQPFFVTFFSVSSHHPYELPPGFENKFSGGPLPIHKMIQYTDRALRDFFHEASKEDWFNNTLFVITADHASGEIYYPQYNSAWGYFSVPIFFYKPGANWSTFNNELIQQIDIMPTVLGYLGYDRPFVAFGRNAFDEATTPYVVNYLNNNYQIFQGDYLLLFDGSEATALYNFKLDPTLSNDLVEQLPEIRTSLEPKLKAFIQQYKDRMVDNNLTMDGPRKKLDVTKKNK